MKTTFRRQVTLHIAWTICCSFVGFAQADTFSTSYTQDGGTLPQNDPSQLTVGASNANPVLRLINGAQAFASLAAVGLDSSAGIPSGGTLLIESGSRMVVSLETSVEGRGAQAGVVVSGANSRLEHGTYYGIKVGSTGHGSLTVEQGGTVTGNYLYVGSGNGSNSGNVLIDGVGSKFLRNAQVPANGSRVTVGLGRNGNGSLEVTNGGLLEAFEVVVANGDSPTLVGTGNFKVSGTGSRLDSLGAVTVGVGYSQGNASLLDGATAKSGPLTIGQAVGGNGSLTIDASRWEAKIGTSDQGVVVGNTGSGQLTVRNGGVLQTGGGRIGNNAGSDSSVTVTGAGSTWNASKNVAITVGGNGGNQSVAGGRGKLDVLAGGQVISEGARIGHGRGGYGEVTVSGSGSVWNTTALSVDRGALYVGSSINPQTQGGIGIMSITAGGQVINDDGYIGAYAGSSGNVSVTGANSTWTNQGSIFVGGTATRIGGPARLTLSDGGAVSTRANGRMLIRSTGEVSIDSLSSLTVGSGGTLVDGGLLSNNGILTGNVVVQNDGLVTGSGQFQSLTIGNAGVVSPGNSPGLLSTTSATWSAGGTYLWEITGLSGAGVGWDLWNTGALTLPASGEFKIQAQTIDGASNLAALAHWNPSRPASWLIAQSTNAAFTPAALDRLILDLTGFQGATPEWFQLGRSEDSRSLLVIYTPVPEPATWVMLIVGLAAFGACRRLKLRARDLRGI